MATIAQIKALFESYISKDDERFITYGLQIAAHEAKLTWEDCRGASAIN